MKHKTAQLEGAPLDAAVAMAEGLGQHMGLAEFQDQPFAFSTCWNHGGPIIEREQIEICYHPNPDVRWLAMPRSIDGAVRRVAGAIINPAQATGQTALIAAMRAYVLMRLGYEVELP